MGFGKDHKLSLKTEPSETLSLKTEAPESETAPSNPPTAPEMLEADARRGKPIVVTVRMPREISEALIETVERLQAAGTGHTYDTLVVEAVQRELTRRGVTWWQTRTGKVLKSGVVR